MIIKKRVGIVSNTEFIKIYTISFGLQPAIDPVFDNLYFSHDEEISIIGKEFLIALNRSRTLQQNDSEYKLLCWSNLENTKYKNDLENEFRKFKYKNKTSLYKNMQYCLADLKNDQITISYSKHSALESWNFMASRFDLIIPSSSAPEITGAAVKYSIARCTGKGADLVAKKLFPDGVPETFDDYLALLNLKS